MTARPDIDSLEPREPDELSDTAKLNLRELTGVFAHTVRKKRSALGVVQGWEVGRTIVLDGQRHLLGRSPECDIVLSGRGISRIHLELRRDDDDRWVLIDRDSLNGTFLNGRRIERRELADRDEIGIGKGITLIYTYEDEAAIDARVATYEASIRDALTGLLNRRHFLRQLVYETHASQLVNEPFSVLLLDIDHFKRVNDRYGHCSGDLVIQQVAACLLDTARQEDSVYRYGGEEFALILAGADESMAQQVAERVRHAVNRLRFPCDEGYFQVTASIGRSTVRGTGGLQIRDIMREADEHLYKAKREGRNRTVGVAAPRTDRSADKQSAQLATVVQRVVR